jgi:predicted ArsR family transcriptional regulator
LQEAGLVEVEKGVERNRPQTRCRITAGGRSRFREYLSVLEHVIADAADRAGSPEAKPLPAPAAGRA